MNMLELDFWLVGWILLLQRAKFLLLFILGSSKWLWPLHVLTINMGIFWKCLAFTPYLVTRKLIWDNHHHHHFYSLLSNTLPMACHTTLKMVKSRTHASMFLWFTTGEFLCNDSRLSECGKRETYCWNSPNVSQGISGFFHLLISSGL